MRLKHCRTTKTQNIGREMRRENAAGTKKRGKDREAVGWLGTNGNRSYNTGTCRRADFPGKKERGADTQDRESVEALPRGQGGSAGLARREFRGAAWRIGCGDGAFGMRQVFSAVCDRRPGASFAWQGFGRRE